MALQHLAGLLRWQQSQFNCYLTHDAMHSAVKKLHTLASSSRYAPADDKKSTIAIRPFAAATCSGVRPPCIIIMQTLVTSYYLQSIKPVYDDLSWASECMLLFTAILRHFRFAQNPMTVR
jgi:hypothetical protein